AAFAPPVIAARAPNATAAKRSFFTMSSSQVECLLSKRTGGASARPLGTDAVEQDRQDDEHADEEILPVGLHPAQDQAVADHLDQRRAGDGPQRAADAAGQ